MHVLNASGLKLENCESIHVVRQWYIDRNDNGRAEITNFRQYLDEAHTRYASQEYEPLTDAYDGWIVLDWEYQGMARLRDGHWKHFLSFLNDVREELPNARIGYYAVPSIRVLTRPEWPEWWRMCASAAEIVQHCDGIFPSCYQQGREFYRDSRSYDIAVRVSLEMANGNKPVYAFIANRWYDLTPWTPISLDRMQAHCEQIASLRSGHWRRGIAGFVFYADTDEHKEENRDRFQAIVNMMGAIT